jgi:hypothetical protein
MAQHGQNDDFTISAIGGRKALQQNMAMQGIDFAALVPMQAAGEGQETAQAQETGAPYNVMQAKQGLDQREDAWNAIVGGGGPQDANQPQDANNLQFNQQQAAQNVADAQLGAELDSKGGDIKDEELKKDFGDQADAIRELLNKRSDVKLSELLPLRKDAAGLSEVVKLLTKNTDLQVSDLVNRGQDGKVTVDKSVTDDECKELMEERPDIKPKEMSALRGQLLKALGNPQLAKKAFSMAIKLLKTRKDMKPEDAGTMFTGISDKMNSLSGSKDKSGSGAAAKLEMFETAVDLLCTRRDLDGEKVLKLVDTTVQTMGDKQDSNSATRVANSFKDASELMKTRQDISVDQVTGFMGNLKQMAPGKDPSALDNRASMFSTACNLLKQRPDMNFDSVTELLKRQTQGQNPKKGNKLMADFQNATAGLAKGQTMDQVAPPIVPPGTQKTEKKDDKKTGEQDEKEKKAGGADEPEEEAGKPVENKETQRVEEPEAAQPQQAEGPQVEQQGGAPGGR